MEGESGPPEKEWREADRSFKTSRRREMEGPEPCKPSSACCKFLTTHEIHVGVLE